VRPYGQYCPVAKGAELLGDRWTLLIVRELLYGPLRFSELERGLPRISKSVLSQRLKALQQRGIVEQTGGENDRRYRFTPAGEELQPVLTAIGNWVGRWIMADPSPAELDAELLSLWLARHVDRGALPGRRIVVELRFLDQGSKRTWLLLDRRDVSMCLHYPGFPLDLVVSGTTADLYRVYIGRAVLADEIRSGTITVEGSPGVRRAFMRSMTWAEAAPVVRDAMLAANALAASG
jgi:DNA-binding HxlR family transcriptional regulator